MHTHIHVFTSYVLFYHTRSQALCEAAAVGDTRTVCHLIQNGGRDVNKVDLHAASPFIQLFSVPLSFTKRACDELFEGNPFLYGPKEGRF
jgi:hypothetical protein